MDEHELRDMVLEYMEKGFLENIIDMFKHDRKLVPLIADMVSDERMRVRLGAIALVEELAGFMPESLAAIIPQVAVFLRDPSPTVRGDAAYLLSLINQSEALPFLEAVRDDPDPAVREVIREAIAEMETRQAV